jgi:cation transport regulator ChaB
MPGRKDLPDTLKRSPKKAQETYLKALESAHAQYDSEERAHRTALAALKHSFKKVGDRWEPKDRPGPSDPQARRSGAAARRGTARTYRGIDVEGSSKAELYEQARKAGIPGRSRMSKRELAEALARRS